MKEMQSTVSNILSEFEAGICPGPFYPQIIFLALSLLCCISGGADWLVMIPRFPCWLASGLVLQQEALTSNERTRREKSRYCSSSLPTSGSGSGHVPSSGCFCSVAQLPPDRPVPVSSSAATPCILVTSSPSFVPEAGWWGSGEVVVVIVASCPYQTQAYFSLVFCLSGLLSLL